jgi:hypothetical protein
VANWLTISGPITLEFPNPKKRKTVEKLMVIMRNSRQKNGEYRGAAKMNERLFD